MGGFSTRSHPPAGMVLRERIYALKSSGSGSGSGRGTRGGTGTLSVNAMAAGGAVDSLQQTRPNPPTAPLQRLWSEWMGGKGSGRQPLPSTATGGAPTGGAKTTFSAGWNDVTTIALGSFPTSESAYGLVAIADDATVRYITPYR